MSRVSTFLFGVVVGALVCHGATNYHVLRAQDGFHMVPKVRAGLGQAYVDVRNFGVADWTANPELSAAVVQDNKQYVMEGAAAKAIQESIQPVLPNWPRQ